MHQIERGLSLVRGLAGQAAELALPEYARLSYSNPRLEAPDTDFLNTEHRAELERNAEIVDFEQLGDWEKIEGVGILRRFGVTTRLGYRYSVLAGTPHKQESDVLMAATTAWGTSTEGHNEHTARALMRAGNHVIVVGAEGSFHGDSQPTGPITLADSAAATLAITRKAGLNNDVLAKERYIIGESRGGMVGLGIVALASDFDQDVIFADLTAPCLPRKVTFEEVGELSGQIFTEPRELFKLGGRIALRTLWHYPSTLDPNFGSLKHQAMIGFALFSGEAGELGKKTDPGTFMHITTFEKDFASMEDEWREIFKYHPRTAVRPLRGGHLTLADPETQAFILARNATFIAARRNGYPLNQDTVFTAAHGLVKNPSLIIKAALDDAA